MKSVIHVPTPRSKHQTQMTHVVIGEDGSKVVTRRLGSTGQGERVGDLESRREGETFGKIGSGSVKEEVGEVGFYVRETQTRSGQDEVEQHIGRGRMTYA